MTKTNRSQNQIYSAVQSTCFLLLKKGKSTFISQRVVTICYCMEIWGWLDFWKKYRRKSHTGMVVFREVHYKNMVFFFRIVA